MDLEGWFSPLSPLFSLCFLAAMWWAAFCHIAILPCHFYLGATWAWTKFIETLGLKNPFSFQLLMRGILSRWQESDYSYVSQNSFSYKFLVKMDITIWGLETKLQPWWKGAKMLMHVAASQVAPSLSRDGNSALVTAPSFGYSSFLSAGPGTCPAPGRREPESPPEHLSTGNQRDWYGY